MLYQGLIIAVIGVCVVFVILGILVVFVNISSILINKFASPSMASSKGSFESLDKSRISAVIVAAISRYRKRNHR